MYEREELMDAVHDYLELHPEGCRLKDIVEAIGTSTQRIQKCLQWLRQSGVFIAEDNGYYWISVSPEDHRSYMVKRAKVGVTQIKTLRLGTVHPLIRVVGRTPQLLHVASSLRTSELGMRLAGALDKEEEE